MRGKFIDKNIKLIFFSLVVMVLVCTITANAASITKIMSLPIYVGQGDKKVKIRVGDIFRDTLDVALNAGAYGLKSDPIGLTSVLVNLPAEFKIVLLGKIEKERYNAYEHLTQDEDLNDSDRAYYGKIVQRLEAAKTWITTGDGTDLSNYIAQAGKKNKSAEPEEITTFSSEKLISTGFFKAPAGSLPFSQNSLIFEMFLDKNSIPQIIGKGRIKIETGGSDAYFSFNINRSEVRNSDPTKTYLRLTKAPKNNIWEIYGRIDLEINGQSAPEDGSIQGNVYLNGNTITGEIFGMNGYLRRVSEFDSVRMLLPGTLNFETHHYF